MLDVHCHVLPGVDDGATSAKMAIAMVRVAREMGVDRIIATPHVREPREIERVHKGFEALRGYCGGKGIALYAGCELRASALMGAEPERIKPLLLGEKSFLLIEFSVEALPHRWEFLLSGLIDQGLHPVIAHPERYAFVQRDFKIVEKMLMLGCELQLSCDSLARSPLMSASARAARKLLKQGVVSYIASDAHRPEDYQAYEKVYREFSSDWPRDGLLEELL